jgi:uncharacterized protein (DUF1800 family)
MSITESGAAAATVGRATPSRRRVVRLGAAAGAGAVAVAATPAAAHAQSYAPGRFVETPLLSDADRHVANRFSYGITPELAAEVSAAGDGVTWFDRQIDTAYDGSADGLCDWWPDLHLDAAAMWERREELGARRSDVMREYANRVLARRMVSPRPVLDLMTEFWENHFHVPLTADNVYPNRVDYGEQIRSRALGRFDELLRTAVLHPAMLAYLGNFNSTKAHPNENLGRELLELHTVGRGNYTEDDVKNSARILTGWRVQVLSTWAGYYSARDHWTGPVRVMGFDDPNASADGQDVAERYLDYLARHPATATRIATKLCRTFVSDAPSASLVAQLARTYLDHDTDIRPVLQELVRSAEFRSSVDAKLRDPGADVVAAYRLLGIQVTPPSSASSAANRLYFQVAALGLAPFCWPRPDGAPSDNAAWASPTRVLASLALHWTLSRSAGVAAGAVYRRPAEWLPRRSMEFRDLVDHLSRLLLHRPSTSVLLRACSEATAVQPRSRVSSTHRVVQSGWPTLVATVLDSPTFYAM